MLEDAEIWGFVPPEKERKMKSKKRVAKKPKKTKKTIKPKQPPYLLYEYLPKVLFALQKFNKTFLNLYFY